MKRILSVMSLAAALFGAVACEDVMGLIEEFGVDTNKLTEISITPSSVTIKAEGGQASIAFEAPSTWSVSSTENWLDFNPAIGTSGEVVVTITARPNTGAERIAVVTVESGKLKATANVIQEGVGGNTQPGDSTAVNPGTDPEKWYVCGTFTNTWDPASSLPMNTRGDGIYTIDLEVEPQAEFKFMKDQSWDVNLGANAIDPVNAGVNIPLVAGGYNLIYNPGGRINVTLDIKNNTALITAEQSGNGVWSVIGTVYGSNWDTDYDMDCGGDFFHYTLYYEDGQEFKFRQNHNWNDPDFGYGPIIMAEPAILDGVQGGLNITLPWTGYWDVYLNPATGQIQFYPWLNAQWEYFKNPDGSVANVTFYSSCFGTAVTGKVKYYEVNGVRTCKTETGGQGLFGLGVDHDWYFVWYTENDCIKLPLQMSGYVDETYGEAILCSPYYYYGVMYADHNPDMGTYWDFVQKYPGRECYYDGNGGFYFGVEWYLFLDAGLGYKPASLDMLGEADGYERHDYSGYVYAGSAVNGTRKIWFEVGRDIASVRYVFLDEKIEDDDKGYAIATQLAEGSIDYNTLTIDMFETDNGRTYYTSVDYTAEVPGYHTVVAVGLDAQGKWYFWYYYWFNLDPVVDTSGYTWSPIGTATLTDDFISSLYQIESLTWEVEVEKCNDDPTRIRLIYPYDGKYPYNEEGDYATDKSYDIEIVIPDNNHVYIPLQESGIDWGYGMIGIGSLGGYYISNGSAVEEVSDSSFGTLVDGVITFPERGLVVSMANYNDGAWYAANRNNAFKLVLPGAEVGGDEGATGADGGTGAAGVARKSVKKAGKPLDAPASGNGAGGRAFKARPALEMAR